MYNATKSHLSTLLLGTLALLAVACGDSTLTLENASSYAFYEVNISPTGDRSWGPNLLGGDTLFPGEVLEVIDIDCDDYDVRILDETDAECILENLELCFDDTEWRITDTDLLVCDIF